MGQKTVGPSIGHWTIGPWTEPFLQWNYWTSLWISRDKLPGVGRLECGVSFQQCTNIIARDMIRSTFLLSFFALCSQCTSIWVTEKLFDIGETGADSIDFTSRGVTTGAFASLDSSIHIFSAYYHVNKTEWTQTAQLIPPDNEKTGFGADVRFVQHSSYTNILLVGRVDEHKKGSLYAYEGTWSSWTQTQLLTSAAHFHKNFFASSIASYQISGSSTAHAVAGCEGCNVTLQSGLLYAFQYTSSQWSETQQLVGPPSTYRNGMSVRMDDRILLSRAYAFTEDLDLTHQVLYFHADSNYRWSYQQTLQPENGFDVGAMDIAGEVAALSTPGSEVDGIAGAGMVYVYTTNTASISTQSTPVFGYAKWSQYQVLTAPIPTKAHYYGQNVKLNAGNLFVGTPENSTVYVYRQQRSFLWTLQQVIRRDRDHFGPMYPSATSLAITSSDYYVELLTDTSSWKCLLISLEDQFGDGWDAAKLQISSEYGIETFSPTCDMNPQVFRYCPEDSSFGGTYTLSVINATMAQFYWEILWRVTSEADSREVAGTHVTTMSYFFNSTTHTFHHVSSASLPVPECGSCNVGSALPINTSTSASNWYNGNMTSTYYYISTSNGYKLLASGTTCVYDGRCGVAVADGDYILRVGGALHRDRASHSLHFCGISASSQSQVLFSVANGICHTYSVSSKSEFCRSTSCTIHSTIDMTVVGVSGSSIRTHDSTALRYTIGSVLELDRGSIRVGNYEIDGDTAFVTILVRQLSSDFGVDCNYISSVKSEVSRLTSLLQSANANNDIFSTLMGYSGIDDTIFSTSSSAYTSSAVLEKMNSAYNTVLAT